MLEHSRSRARAKPALAKAKPISFFSSRPLAGAIRLAAYISARRHFSAPQLGRAVLGRICHALYTRGGERERESPSRRILIGSITYFNPLVRARAKTPSSFRYRPL